MQEVPKPLLMPRPTAEPNRLTVPVSGLGAGLDKPSQTIVLEIEHDQGGGFEFVLSPAAAKRLSRELSLEVDRYLLAETEDPTVDDQS